MNNILIVGTSFSHNGFGIPSANSVFYDNISNSLNVTKIDILNETLKQVKHKNNIFSRNLYLLTIKNKIIGKNIHVMHTIDLCPTIPLIDMSKYAKKKIITVHDFYPFYNKYDKTLTSRLNGILKMKCYKYLSGYDHIFARTKEISNVLINDYKIPPNKISIQGPIIGYEYSPMNIDDYKEKTIIGYINNFNWNKTQMLKYFINIFKSIKSKELEFHIYGKNFPLQNLIKKDSRIKYFGFLEEEQLPYTLARFNVYLSTSIIEGFSEPIAKAKAMRIPVLSYNGELPEVTKRNTLLWDRNNLKYIILNRLWDCVDTKKAYMDITNLRPELIVKQTVDVYKNIFGA